MKLVLILPTLVVLCACGSDDAGAMDPDAGTEPHDESGSDDGTPNDGTADGGTADGGTADGGGSSGAVPELCDMPDPEVDGTFDVAPEDWEVEFCGDESREMACTVDVVEIVDSAISSALTCLDDLGNATPVEVQVAGTTSGAPAWSAGDEVTLTVRQSDLSCTGGVLPGGIVGPGYATSFAMRRAEDGALLAAASDAGVGDLSPLQLEVTDDEICGEIPPDYNSCGDPQLSFPVAIRVSEPGGTHVDLLGDQRGILPLADGTELHIDAPVAHRHSGDCHSGPGNAFHIVTRRVSP